MDRDRRAAPARMPSLLRALPPKASPLPSRPLRTACGERMVRRGRMPAGDVCLVRLRQARAGRRARACRFCRGRHRRGLPTGSRPFHPSGWWVVCARSPGGGAPAGPEGLMRVQLGGFSSAADRQWHPTRGLPRRRVPRPNPWRSSSSCWRRMLRCTPPRHLIFPSPSTLHCWGGPREACGNERACQTWSSSPRTGQRAGTCVTLDRASVGPCHAAAARTHVATHPPKPPQVPAKPGLRALVLDTSGTCVT